MVISEKEMISQIYEILEKIMDPEIPVLSIIDLGIVRDVRLNPEGKPEVVITPTYSGCPATDYIRNLVETHLKKSGFAEATVSSTLTPAWTTDWISDSGREKLRQFGIAPPVESSVDKQAILGSERVINCPLCNSQNTEMISQFGSTPCKALFRCLDCLEPFDYFKCH